MLLMPMFSPSSDRDELHARHAPKRGLALREKLNALLDQLGADDRNHRAGENALGVLDPHLRGVASDLAWVLHMNFHEVDDVRVKHHLGARDHRHGLRNPKWSDLDSLSPSAAPLPLHRVPPSPWRCRTTSLPRTPGLSAPTNPEGAQGLGLGCRTLVPPRLLSRGYAGRVLRLAFLARHAGSRVSPALRMVNPDRTGLARVRTGSRHPPRSCRLPVKRNSRHRKIDNPRLPRPAHGRSCIANAGSGSGVQHEVAVAVELVPRLRQPASSTRAPKSPFSSQRFREVPQPYHPQRRQAAQARNQTT